MTATDQLTTTHDVLDAILARARQTPTAVALTETRGQSLTYGDLAATLDRLAANLRAAGMRPSDRVCFMVRPGNASVLLILAILRVGATVVAMDPTVGDALFAARMARIPPRWLIAESALFALSRFAPVRALLRRRGLALPNLSAVADAGCTLVAVGPRLPGVPRGALRYEDFVGESSKFQVPSSKQKRHETAQQKQGRSCNLERGTWNPSDPAFVVFTSGTTAQPKAVVHTAMSLGESIACLAAHLALTPADVVYTNELHLIVPALMAGARCVLRTEHRFDPARFLAHITEYGVTHTFAVPSDFDRVVSHLTQRGAMLPAHLRLVMFGSAPVERGFLARCRPVIPPATTVVAVYAMTEVLPVAAVTLPEKLAYTGDGDLVGTLFPGIHARIAADGELLLSGPRLFRGYAGMPDVTEHPTGDLARLDDAGRLVLLGRKKEMIIRGQYNIYPALIESTVSAIPGVRACALIGVYDAARADERVVLAVEPLAGESHPRLRARLERELRTGPHSIDVHAYPDAILFAPLPRSGRSHKVDRRALAALARERLP